MSEHATHAVFNQPPPLEDVNLFTSDRVLTEALRREGAEWAESQARTFGEIWDGRDAWAERCDRAGIARVRSRSVDPAHTLRRGR